MNFKMYGNYKYDLYNELYTDNEGNTLIIEGNRANHWIAKFSKYDTVLEADSFEDIDRMVEDFIYVQKSNEEKIKTFHKPPVINKEMCIAAAQISEKLEKTE